MGASCGRYNTQLLDDQGRLHVIGYDGCGSDGVLPERDQAYKARLVQGELTGKKVAAFDSGKRDASG